MDEYESKAEVIKETIESTIGNAIDTQAKLERSADEKEQQKLLTKNEGRALAIPSLIRQMKEAEAAEEISKEQGYVKEKSAE